jgi:hypothetical protein
MNMTDYPNGVTSLGMELTYVFPISLIVIFFSLLLAFDKFSLALLLYCVNVPAKWISTRVAMCLPGLPLLQSRRGGYRRLNELRVKKVRELEEGLERVRLVRETKLFWERVEAEQKRKRATGPGVAERVKSWGLDV